ncbi:MAG: SIMPL domain-containing protein [Anaerolineaceae bacterium]|jgi:uncharacterized protein YggE
MEKRNFRIIIPLVLIGILLLGACQLVPQAGNQAADATSGARTITVTGSGEVILVPDLAYINVGIHTEAEDVTSAVNSNNSQARAIKEAMVGMGVEEKDIQTSNFNVYSMNRYDDMGNIAGTNYAVDNTLYIIVRDMPRMSEILDAALGAGANQIYGISFDIANRADAMAQARDLAIKDAEEKALSIANTAGVQLGQVLNISVKNNSYVQTLAGYGMGGGMMDQAASVPVSAGQIVVTANADVVYEFGDR